MRSPPKHPYLPEKFAAARQHRAGGASMKRIAAELGVSLSTVSLWVRDIELTAEQKQANRLRGAQVRAERWRERHRDERRALQLEGREQARHGDALHEAGCMLYWAEGNKSRNALSLANSDRPLVAFFARFLRQCFAVEDERFTVALNVYLGNGLALRDIEQYWLTGLELPDSCLRKHTLNHRPTSSSGLKPNKLPHGVCRLSVLRSRAIVQHIYGAIQEYADFEEPRWLDGLYS